MPLPVPVRLRLSAIGVAAALLLGACAGADRAPTADLSTAAIAPVTTAARPAGCGQPSTPARSWTARAVAVGDLDVYDTPGAPTPARAMPNPRLVNGDPAAAVPLVLLVKDAPVAADCAWVEVYLPVRPNGSTGWVRRSSVELTANPYRLEADLTARRLTLLHDGVAVRTIPVAVGAAHTPTPVGLYFVTELVAPADPDGVYGPYAFGLSGFSEALETFNGGPAQLAIHGTNQPRVIGQDVSNGCLRMHNDDITALTDILPLGVPVQILA